jgi:hypothetical protein
MQPGLKIKQRNRSWIRNLSSFLREFKEVDKSAHGTQSKHTELPFFLDPENVVTAYRLARRRVITYFSRSLNQLLHLLLEIKSIT